jgi:hypothetical protein
LNESADPSRSSLQARQLGRVPLGGPARFRTLLSKPSAARSGGGCSLVHWQPGDGRRAASHPCSYSRSQQSARWRDHEFAEMLKAPTYATGRTEHAVDRSCGYSASNTSTRRPRPPSSPGRRRSPAANCKSTKTMTKDRPLSDGRHPQALEIIDSADLNGDAGGPVHGRPVEQTSKLHRQVLRWRGRRISGSAGGPAAEPAGSKKAVGSACLCCPMGAPPLCCALPCRLRPFDRELQH